MSGRTPNNDPLAELARLIGQDDPFRDARPDGGRAAPRREAPAQPYVEAPRSAPGWLARNSAAPAHDDPPARYDDAHDERDAHYESDARYQDDPRYGDPQYEAAAYQDGAQGHQAAEYEAGYDPAHGDDADHYYDEGHYENYGEADEAPRRRSGLAIVVAVVGLAVLGTGGVFAYRALTGGSSSSGQVQVVKAPDTPNKVVPAPQADQSGKQIYDRVTDKGGNEKIGTAPEEPVDVKGGNPRNSITGLIQGVPPGGVAQPPPAPPATQQASVPPPEPKKVKTVPIRPDQPTGTTTVPPRAAATAPAPSPAPAPVRLGANQTPAPPARNTAVAGGFVVQVASQRSEADAQASYKVLQTKYPTVLGDREAFVRKADLGDKGTFYRAQIGPFTTVGEANELCASLKTAGGQCVVQKN